MNSTAAQESITPKLTIALSRGTIAFKSLLGLLLMIMGAAGTGALWIAYQRAAETRSWTPVPCVIIASQLLTERESPHSPITYRADIRYRYRFNDAAYTGTRILRSEGPSTDKSKVARLIAAYPPGTSTICYVNPSIADFAILQHASFAPLYSIWFPLLFVVGGAGMIVSAFRWRTAKAEGPRISP